MCVCGSKVVRCVQLCCASATESTTAYIICLVVNSGGRYAILSCPSLRELIVTGWRVAGEGERWREMRVGEAVVPAMAKRVWSRRQKLLLEIAMLKAQYDDTKVEIQKN